MNIGILFTLEKLNLVRCLLLWGGGVLKFALLVRLINKVFFFFCQILFSVISFLELTILGSYS